MKNILPIILIGSFIAFLNASCKKGNNNTPDNKIVGTWQETKLTVHETNGTPADRDTTFTGSSLTKGDYIQFNKDETATVSQSGIYSSTGKSIVLSGGTVVDAIGKYAYSITDSTLLFKSLTVIPIGNTIPESANKKILQLDATHLVLFTTYLFSPPLVHTETAYFTKKN